MKMNQSKFGQLVGCSQQNISKLITKGILLKSEDNKLDVEFSLQKLRDHGLLDENDKLIKSRTPKDENENTKIISLPFDEPVPYKTIADLTPEEREQIEKEEIEAFEELEAKKKVAKNKNIDSFDNNLGDFTYARAKAHREYYLGQTAELDHKIKLGEYISREDAETTFFEAGRGVRDSLLSSENKLAPRLINKTDIREIKQILRDEFNYVLSYLQLGNHLK